MEFSKYVKRTVYILGLLVLLILIALTIGIPVNLNGIREKAETTVSKALGRNVYIDGHLAFEVSFRPSVELEGLRISNPPSWDTDNFVGVNRFQAQIRILPLLRGRIHIQEINANGIDVHLESKPHGEKNWLFDFAKKTAESSAPSTDSADGFAVELVEVDELSLTQINVTFLDHDSDQKYEFRLDSMQGIAVADEPLQLSIQGAFQKQRYFIDINGDPIAELFNPTQSWHLDVSAEMAGATLNVSGQADRPLEGKAFDFKLKLEGDDLDTIEALIDSPLPQIGAYALNARLKKTENGYSLSELKGNIGETTFNGKFDVDLSQDRPAIVYQLTVPILDARPWLEVPQVQPEPAALKSDDIPQDFDALTFSLEILNKFDADAELKVDRVINLPGDIRNASLKVDVHEGALMAPMKLTFADVAFHGNLDLKTIDDAPKFLLSLTANQTNIGKLALIFIDTEGIEGHLETFEFSLAGRGKKLKSLIKNIDMHFALNDAALSYGNVAGGRPVHFTLEQAEIAMVHDQDMTVSANGTLLDVPFQLAVSGGSHTQILSGDPWPIDLSASGGGAHLSLKGSISKPNDPAGSNLNLDVSDKGMGGHAGSQGIFPALKLPYTMNGNLKLTGKRIGDLAAWLGISPTAKLPYAMRGNLKLTGKQWEINSLDANLLSANLGKTKFIGKLGWKHGDQKPLLIANLTYKNIDPGELGSIVASDQSKKQDATGGGLTIDMPLIPQKIEFHDADIDINVNRIHFKHADIKDISLSSRIRDGWVNRSPIQAVIGDVLFKGDFSLDLRNKVPAFKFKIDSTKVDIGMLLAELNIVEGMDADVGSLGLDLNIKGASLRTILDQSEFAARMKDGHWTIRDPNTNASLQVRVLECVVQASAGQPVTWSIDGRIKKEPVKIEIKGDRLAVLADEKVRMPLKIVAEAAGVELELSSLVDLPLDQNELDFKMLLRGERLNSINSFLGVDLPPYGPYKLGGRFQVKKNGYSLSDLSVNVNQSHMTGKMSLATKVKPPRLDIDLTTRTLQIDDFRVGDWSPVEKTPTAKTQKNAQQVEAEKPAEPVEVPSLLSSEFMRSLDADFKLKVEEVLSGKDNLGSGNLEAGLKKGRFFVDPLQLEIPGGSVKIAFAFEPTESNVVLEASARIEQLDYGVLARRIKPESKMGGRLSLDVDLKSRANSVDTIMQHADGYIDFAVVPENFEADIFELWAVNLLAAALPKLDSEESSIINCAVFRFDLKDGMMKQDAIFADTTKMQVSGKAKVNFKTQDVYLAMAPKAKKPQFLSLATPIQVKGTFNNYKIDVQPGGIIGTAFRFITSPVVVPIQRIFTERAPADGKAACSAAMHRAHN
ncbi:MAG: AsmA family protein [Desulfobacterales bacterium]|jgi:hypothetical protein